MSSFSPRAILDEKCYDFMAPTDDLTHIDELARLKMELAILKNANPFLVAEIALELQIERMRVAEAMKARDSALNRLCDAYVSIRQKNEIIERMQEERESNGASPFPTHLIRVRDTVEIDQLKAHIVTLEATIEELRSVVSKPTDPPPCYEENIQKKLLVDRDIQTDESSPVNNFLEIISGEASADDPQELVKARNAVLADIPLPDSPPDATLAAIVFPPPVTLHEFLNLAPAPLKNALSTYRILQNTTTTWCPDREEHGFMYVPAFKCSTNPKIATAHRWTAVDPVGKMNKPTECFYHKDGVWYYAGSYKAFKMDTLSTKEWSQLASEVTSAIVKETISGRKNSSPQNTYETSQLYASGALKVVCIGLQCVGFNQDIYKAILEHAAHLTETKWKPLIALAAVGSPSSNSVAGTGALPTSAAAKTPKTPGVPRHVQRASATASAVGSPINSQGPPAVSQMPNTSTTFGAGIPAFPLGTNKPSIWNVAANAVGPSLAASGGVASLTASPSPLSATSKIFESSRGPITGDTIAKR
ncbi:hypothetical protein BJ912DRAFT_911328 [Pholiota molesta]|nr:hypothetical protein BJ912DRAFT_911328 [Pholiota molesta]